MVKVSVIVPVYNSEDYLKKCISSLVNQTLKDIEFIIINDGSTDSSDEIIKSFKDKRIKYFKRDNHGIGATRNFGIEKATGKYIGFVDSDDYIAPEMFQVMYDACVKDDLDVVICDFYKEIGYDIQKIHLTSFDVTDLKSMPNLIMDINLAPWNKLYKSSIIKNDNILFPVGVKYEDTPWVLMALSKALKIGKIDDALYHYVVRSNSETTVIDKRVYDIFKITDILLSDFADNVVLKGYVDDLVIYLITKYTVSQRYLKNKKKRDKFIDCAFVYLNKKIPNFKNSNYFKNREFFKGLVEKSKLMTKLHCDLYSLFKK